MTSRDPGLPHFRGTSLTWVRDLSHIEMDPEVTSTWTPTGIGQSQRKLTAYEVVSHKDVTGIRPYEHVRAIT